MYDSIIYASKSFTLLDTALWYFRLGHLSHTKMHLLNYKSHFIFIDQKVVYDICHLARHKKFPYATSFNKASKLCDLIHLDI